MIDKLSNVAMIFAAGFGKRLGDLTIHNPKPLIPIHDTNCLKNNINKLFACGVEKIIVNTHYLAHQIQSYLSNYSNILCVFEPMILETGGAVKNVIEYFDSKPFFAINGDIWWNDDKNLPSLLQKMHDVWQPSSMDILLGLVSQDNYLGKRDFTFNYSKTNNSLQITDCNTHTYMGVQILQPRIFDQYTKGQSFSLKEIYNNTIKKQRIFGLEHNGYWADIGSFAGLENCIKQYKAK